MLFLYKVEFYDDYLGKDIICKGFVEGETYMDAFDAIIDGYGHDNIENIHIAALIAKDEHYFELDDTQPINDTFFAAYGIQ